MLESPLRIALLTHSVNPRGGVVHTLELARALHDGGHAVTVFAPAAEGERLFRAVPFAVELVRIATCAGTLAERVGARIDAFEQHLGPRLRTTPFDVLHAQDPIGANALANLQERGLAGGFIRTVHHLDEFDDPQLAAWQLRGFLAARQVLCVSRVWCEHLSRCHGVDAALVRNGVDLDRYRREPQPGDAAVVERLGLRPGAPVFLAVGGVEERKNSVRLLQAFVRVRHERPGARLVIAGGASLLDHAAEGRAFQHELDASALRLGTDVVLTGPLPDAAMPALFRAADVLAMPSLREGFGLVVLEALACGTPVVASAIAPFTEHLSDAECCWADPLDVGSIAVALQRALAPARAAALARATPEVCLRHSWPASAVRHLEIYRGRLAALTPASQLAALIPPSQLAASTPPSQLAEGCVPCP